MRSIYLALAIVLSTIGLAHALAPEPKADADPKYLEAAAMIDAQNYAPAIPLLKSVVDQDPMNADAWSQLGYAARKTGDYENSEKYYNNALTLDPNHLEAIEYMGELYVETDRLPRAKVLLDRLKTLCPSGCEPLEELEEVVAAAEGN